MVPVRWREKCGCTQTLFVNWRQRVLVWGCGIAKVSDREGACHRYPKLQLEQDLLYQGDSGLIYTGSPVEASLWLATNLKPSVSCFLLSGARWASWRGWRTMNMKGKDVPSMPNSKQLTKLLLHRIQRESQEQVSSGAPCRMHGTVK